MSPTPRRSARKSIPTNRFSPSDYDNPTPTTRKTPKKASCTTNRKSPYRNRTGSSISTSARRAGRQLQQQQQQHQHQQQQQNQQRAHGIVSPVPFQFAAMSGTTENEIVPARDSVAGEATSRNRHTEERALEMEEATISSTDTANVTTLGATMLETTAKANHQTDQRLSGVNGDFHGPNQDGGVAMLVGKENSSVHQGDVTDTLLVSSMAKPPATAAAAAAAIVVSTIQTSLGTNAETDENKAPKDPFAFPDKSDPHARKHGRHSYPPGRLQPNGFVFHPPTKASAAAKIADPVALAAAAAAAARARSTLMAPPPLSIDLSCARTPVPSPAVATVTHEPSPSQSNGMVPSPLKEAQADDHDDASTSVPDQRVFNVGNSPDTVLEIALVNAVDDYTEDSDGGNVEAGDDILAASLSSQGTVPAVESPTDESVSLQEASFAFVETAEERQDDGTVDEPRPLSLPPSNFPSNFATAMNAALFNDSMKQLEEVLDSNVAGNGMKIVVDDYTVLDELSVGEEDENVDTHGDLDDLAFTDHDGNATWLQEDDKQQIAASAKSRTIDDTGADNALEQSSTSSIETTEEKSKDHDSFHFEVLPIASDAGNKEASTLEESVDQQLSAAPVVESTGTGILSVEEAAKGGMQLAAHPTDHGSDKVDVAVDLAEGKGAGQDVEPTMPDGTVTVDNYFFATAAKDDTEVGTTEVTSVQSGTAVSAEAVDNGVETAAAGNGNTNDETFAASVDWNNVSTIILDEKEPPTVSSKAIQIVGSTDVVNVAIDVSTLADDNGATDADTQDGTPHPSTPREAMIAARAGVNSFGKMLEKSAQILNVCKADCAKKWVVISESGREFVSLVKKVGSDATALAYEDKVATLPKAIREEIASFNLGSIGKRFSAFNDYYHQLKWEGFAMGRCDVLARGLLRAVKNRAGSTSGGSVIGDGNVETARFTVDPRSSGIDVAVLDDDQTFQGLQNAMLGVKRDCKEAWQTNELKAHELESLATEVEQVLCCTFEEKAALLPVSSEDDENDISHQRDVWKAFSEHLQGLSTLVRKAVAEMHAMVENQAAVKSSRS